MESENLKNRKRPLVIITGPTASGKSSVGVELARMINGAVVSADSVQIYRGMDIGSAKITAEEMKGVEHFLISELDPDEEFNVSVFVDMAENAIERIYGSGSIPIIVGGTAFYIQALLKGVVFDEETGADEEFRRDCEEVYENPDSNRWEEFLGKYFDKFTSTARDNRVCSENPLTDSMNATEGSPQMPCIVWLAQDRALNGNITSAGYLLSDDLYDQEYPVYELLKMVDPEYAGTLHPNNRKRVIRALEYFKATGEKYSEYNKREESRESRFDHHYFVLEDDRAALYDRINKRVDEMITAGLEAEVKGLLEKGYSQEIKSMQSIGYKEMCLYIAGECSLESAVDAIKQNTRHFAKRQMTWFRREKDVITVETNNFCYEADKIAEKIFLQCSTSIL